MKATRARFTGLNMREALRAAADQGCQVATIRRTGEYSVTHGSVPIRLRINARRKDAPRALTTFLGRVCQSSQQQ